jgi:glycosyltransferase involved in cell wall biosynthesis
MNDSPKNREYVEESGAGLVCDPNPEAIRTAVAILKSTDWGDRGRNYIMAKYTSRHYADAILAGINKVLNK